MKRISLKNRWVVVTGASSGLGMELARYLAGVEKAHLVLSARREKRLLSLKEEIEKNGESKVEIVVADLSTEEGVRRLFSESTGFCDVFGLINNAGLTFYGPTTKDNLEIFEKIIDLDFKSVMRLTLLFLAHFLKKEQGFIFNVTSAAGFMPMPYQNVYASAKRAIQNFSQALREENRGNAVTISTFAPGGINTEMYTSSGLDRRFGNKNPFNMSAEKVAQKAVRALKKGKSISIPGFSNKLLVFLVRFLPMETVCRLTGKIYQPPSMDS